MGKTIDVADDDDDDAETLMSTQIREKYTNRQKGRQ